MKKFVKVNHMLLIICFFLMDCGSKSNKRNLGISSGKIETSYEQSARTKNSYCDLNTAYIIGKLYVLSCPSLNRDETAIENMVSEIDFLLEEDAYVIKCMRRLGELMVQQGMQNFNFNFNSENQVRARVMDMANSAGLEINAVNIADRAVSGMRNEQLQPVIIGNELIWLSEVLPDAANDEWDAYLNTGTIFRRQALQQIAQIKQTLILIGNSDPEAVELLGIVLPVVDKWSTEYGIGYIIGTGIHLGVFK